MVIRDWSSVVGSSYLMAIVVEPKAVVMEKIRKEKQTIVDNDDPFAKYDK